MNELTWLFFEYYDHVPAYLALVRWAENRKIIQRIKMN